MSIPLVIGLIVLNFLIWIFNWELNYFYMNLRRKVLRKIKIVRYSRIYHNRKLSAKIVDLEKYYELN